MGITIVTTIEASSTPRRSFQEKAFKELFYPVGKLLSCSWDDSFFIVQQHLRYYACLHCLDNA